MCNWQSPKLSFVLISPWPTIATPSSTFQFSPFSHFDKSLPSNRTVASDGGSAFVFPGVTTGGSSHSIPDMYSWPETMAERKLAAAMNVNWMDRLNIVGDPWAVRWAEWLCAVSGEHR